MYGAGAAGCPKARTSWSPGLPVTGSEDPRINAMLKELLTAWCEFLSSRDSLYVLNDSPDREGEGEA
jgi:phosphatidylserine decarboxylase